MIFRRLALLLVMVALVGCNNEKNRNLLDKRIDQAIQMGQEAQAPAPKKSYDPLTVSNKVWSGNASVRLRRGIPLPSKYEGARGVTLISAEPMSLGGIVAAMTTQTGIPIRLVDGATSGGSGGGAGVSLTGAPIGGASNNDDIDTSQEMLVSYEGSLSGLLDMAAGQFGLNWRYDGATIFISRYETRVFLIESMPGKQKVKDGVKDVENTSSSTTSGGGNAGNSLKQTSEMDIEMTFWDELTQTLTALLNGTGTVIVSPTSGIATVTTTPEIMRTVAKYIEEENRRLTKQIAINVEIFTVEMGEEASFNVTFETALKRLTALGGNITGATGPAASVSEMANLSVAVLNPKSTGEITSVFGALSTIGDTTRVSQFPLTTLNNKTVTRRVGRDITYIKSISDTTSGSDFTSTSAEPGNIREGFSLQLTPRLLDDGRIMMQYSMSLLDVISNEPITIGSGVIQLPETATRVFVQQALLRSGSTLIIGGYDDETTRQNSNGVGSAYNYFLGGGSSNEKSRSMMFIAITPQVLDAPRAERT